MNTCTTATYLNKNLQHSRRVREANFHPWTREEKDAALSKSHMKSRSQADELHTDVDTSSALVGGIQSSQPRVEGCARIDDAWMPSANRRCNLTLRVCPATQLQLPEPGGPFGSNILASSSRLAIVLDGHVIRLSKFIPSSPLQGGGTLRSVLGVESIREGRGRPALTSLRSVIKSRRLVPA